LGFFFCEHNNFSNIDLSYNKDLGFFFCEHNNFSNIDLSYN